MISHCEQRPKTPSRPQPAKPSAPAPAPPPATNGTTTEASMEIATVEEEVNIVGPRKLPAGPKPFGPAAPPTQKAPSAKDSPAPRVDRKRISPPKKESPRREPAPKADHRQRKVISPPPRSPPRERKSASRYDVESPNLKSNRSPLQAPHSGTFSTQVYLTARKGTLKSSSFRFSSRPRAVLSKAFRIAT